MKINNVRLKSLLMPVGFVDAVIESDSMTFVRTDKLDGLFQKVHVDRQGRREEAVYGNVSVSATKYLHLKIDERRHLTELDIDKDRNWTILNSSEDAMDWEQRFARIAPAAVEAYARERGDELLRRTGRARQWAMVHLQRLNSSQSLDQQIFQFEVTKGADFCRAAGRLAEWPGVMQVFDADEVYMLASCAVLSGPDEAISGGQDPLHNNELMWQIQLVADGILSWQKKGSHE